MLVGHAPYFIYKQLKAEFEPFAALGQAGRERSRTENLSLGTPPAPGGSVANRPPEFSLRLLRKFKNCCIKKQLVSNDLGELKGLCSGWRRKF